MFGVDLDLLCRKVEAKNEMLQQIKDLLMAGLLTIDHAASTEHDGPTVDQLLAQLQSTLDQ